MPNDAQLQEWKRAHDLLLQKERLFAAKAIEHALGRAAADELGALEREVREMRRTAHALFEAAFGLARSKER
jgi:hypothetical protein